MAQVAGDGTAAAPVKPAPADAAATTLNELLHNTNGLGRDGAKGGPFNVDPTTLKLHGLDGLTPAQPAPPDKSTLPPLVISTPGEATAKPAPAKPAPVQGSDQSQDDLSEGKASKIGREALVLGGGLARSTLYGMASLPQRVPELGASVAIGATLSTIARSGEWGAAATLFVGAYFTSRFVVNAIGDTNRWQKFSSAVTDTWNSNKNEMQDLRDVSDTGGNFAFDAALSYGAGYVGYKNPELAQVILGGLRLPVPTPALPGTTPKFPLPPAIMNASMYLSIVPPPLLYRHHYDDYPANQKSENK